MALVLLNGTECGALQIAAKSVVYGEHLVPPRGGPLLHGVIYTNAVNSSLFTNEQSPMIWVGTTVSSGWQDRAWSDSKYA